MVAGTGAVCVLDLARWRGLCVVWHVGLATSCVGPLSAVPSSLGRAAGLRQGGGLSSEPEAPR
jgi:hypothetical protein